MYGLDYFFHVIGQTIPSGRICLKNELLEPINCPDERRIFR